MYDCRRRRRPEGGKKILETKKYRFVVFVVGRSSRILYRQGPGFAGRSIGGGRVGGGRIVVVVVEGIKKYTQFCMVCCLFFFSFQGLPLPQLVLPLAVLLLS